MVSRHVEPARVRWARAAGTGAAVLLVVSSWSAGAAWGVEHTPLGKSSGSGRAQTAVGGGQGGGLPVIGNATDLRLEPVVHATKGKPPTKLEVKDLVVGTGATVKKSSTVRVIYVGADYATGKDFTQATWTEKHPTVFALDGGGVLRGFAEGLVGMKVGGRREIVIPPALGYGDEGTGPIEPDETLVFVVDLKGVSG